MSDITANAVRVLRHALEFVRPKIIITCSVIALLGVFSSGTPTADLIVVLPLLIMWYIHAASANDYADRFIDAVNIPGAQYRPLLNQRLSARELWLIHGIAGALSILLASYFGIAGVALVSVILFFDYAYSFRPFYIAGRGILSQLMLPLAYVILPFTLGTWSSQQTLGYNWLLMIGIYIGFAARLFLKDFRDTKGDAKYGKRTFLVRHGVAATCLTSGLFAVVSFILIASALGNNLGVSMALLLLHVVALLLLVELRGTKDNQSFKTIGTLAKIGNISIIVLLLHYVLVQCIPNNDLLANLAPFLVGVLLVARTKRQTGLWLALNSPSFFQHLIWVPLRIFMHLCCSVKINGIEHLQGVKGNAILASNHVTELDPLIIVASMPFFSRQLPTIYVVREKSYYAKNWKGIRKALYGGAFFELIGGYEAFRGLGDYEKALVNHLQALEKGQSVCIFPVGRWHTDDEYTQARGGVSFLAAKTGRPIIPIHIQGISSTITLKEYLQRKPKLVITFGKPIYADDLLNAPASVVRSSDRKSHEQAAAKLMKTVSKLK